MPDDFGVTVVTMLVCFFICMRGCGRVVRPAFPAPSEFQMAFIIQNLRGCRGEIAEAWVLSRRKVGRADKFVRAVIA